MIKTNLIATIVVNKELEVHVKTSDDDSMVIIESPVPKMPIDREELRAAITICSDFVLKRNGGAPHKVDLGPNAGANAKVNLFEDEPEVVGSLVNLPRGIQYNNTLSNATDLSHPNNQNFTLTNHADEHVPHVDMMYGDDEH